MRNLSEVVGNVFLGVFQFAGRNGNESGVLILGGLIF